ncbi:MAG: hypothetical protein AMXMBFR46_05000, partial [Acidimicrobiia bacterium]
AGRPAPRGALLRTGSGGRCIETRLDRLGAILGRYAVSSAPSRTRAASARFVCSKPSAVAPRPRLRRGTRTPRKVSPCTRRHRSGPRGSITKLCSPSNRPGTRIRPSHRSSCAGVATTTRGRKVNALPPGGWSRTSSRAPGTASPAIATMNGFHSG